MSYPFERHHSSNLPNPEKRGSGSLKSLGRYLASFFLLWPLTGQSHGGDDIYSMGNRRELFVDHFLIEKLSGDAELKLHQPVSAGTVLRMDEPWEGNVSLYASIIEDEGLYRMYYRGMANPDYVVKKNLREGETYHEGHSAVVAYAESRDGIHWEKPELGLHPFGGSRKNNILLVEDNFEYQETHNFHVFIDGNPETPDSGRYKAVAGVRKLFGFVSADGIHWKKVREKPILTDGYFDSHNVVFWDAERSRYVAIYRDFIHGVRTIKFATSENFLDWTEGVWADFGEAPPEHLYTNATTPYFRAPHIYLSFPKRFMPYRTVVHDGLNNGLSDGVFMSSRDGIHWHRFREAFIRPGRDQRNWIHRSNAVSSGIFQLDEDTISLYVTRNYTYPSVHVERMKIRLDGFVSAHAGMEGGELLTKPFTFDGLKAEGASRIVEEDKSLDLFLNFATSAAGSIRLEIQDIHGNPIPGFTLVESPVLYGDRIDRKVQWPRPGTRTDSDLLNSLAGKPIRLRFVLKDADLYSLQFRAWSP